MVKTPKGELTGAELRKLIRAHNILVSIKIPKGTDREGLIKLIEGKGYKVDHKKKVILDAKKDRPRRPKVTLDKAKELTKPKPKTALQQQKAVEAKAEKEEKKKKEVRAIKKEAIKGVMDRKKALKKKSIENNKEEMPKPKQPKATQKFKSQKEDEVRPKEKVGRPRVDPKKIKVIEPKKKKKTFDEMTKKERQAFLKEKEAAFEKSREEKKQKAIQARKDKEEEKRKVINTFTLEEATEELEIMQKRFQDEMEKGRNLSNEGRNALSYQEEKERIRKSKAKLKFKIKILKERIKDLKKNKNVSNNKKDMDFKIGDTYLFKTKNGEIEGIVETIQEKSVSVFYKTNEGDYKSRRVVKGNVIKRLGGTNYNEDLKKNFKGTSPKKQEKKKEEIKIDFEKTFNEAKKKLDMFISQNKDLKTKDFSKFNKVNDYRKEINYDLFFEVSKLNDKLRSLKLDKDQREKVEKQREKILELNKQIKLTYKFRKNPKG